MNEIVCPVCSQKSTQSGIQQYIEPITRVDYKLYFCKNCEVEFWTPLIMPPPSYYEKQCGADYKSRHEEGNLRLQPWHKVFIKNYDKLDLKGKILDVGCADGGFLRRMKDLGWDVYGIEMDTLSSSNAKINCKTDYIFPSFEALLGRIEPNSFDIITFFEVLEHQADPKDFIASVKKLIKKNGRIAGSVPNRDRYIVAKRFSPDIPPHHFTLWNHGILNRFVKSQGFDNFRFFYARYEPHLINQLVSNMVYHWLSRQKLKLGMQSFHESDRSEGYSLKSWVLINGKRWVWSPLIKIVSIMEYPFLYWTKKSISIAFDAKIVSEKEPKN
jgi:SAM-dependent methyltransferase